MSNQSRAEVFKLRTTRSTWGMALGLIGLVTFAVILHALSLPPERIDSASAQLTIVFGWGERFAALFAALLGAMTITSEFRHGTIRPTLIAAPRRVPLIVGKVIASTAAGLVLGVLAGLYAAGISAIALTGRGIDLAISTSDVVELVAGSAAAAALWAAIGVGIGAVVRSQVPTLVALTTWLLLVESLLVENVSGVGRFAPGATGQALSGQSPGTLLASGWAAALLLAYAAGAVAIGCWATVRRDIT
jgi:ABC-type transport system involved in multi-copper enzyme maturation permease subunit